MGLNNAQKQKLKDVMISIIQENHCEGINTRQLISDVYTQVSSSIPNVNRYHIAGMIAWVINSTSHQLIVRKPGYSVIA